jgi:hypothetical protein
MSILAIVRQSQVVSALGGEGSNAALAPKPSEESLLTVALAFDHVLFLHHPFDRTLAVSGALREAHGRGADDEQKGQGQLFHCLFGFFGL